MTILYSMKLKWWGNWPKLGGKYSPYLECWLQYNILKLDVMYFSHFISDNSIYIVPVFTCIAIKSVFNTFMSIIPSTIYLVYCLWMIHINVKKFIIMPQIFFQDRKYYILNWFYFNNWQRYIFSDTRFIFM